ncbi:hypothetical protein [Nevskia ramosa]|uniref:hypothetical protein n=1 Tax=Nevskia ramosa TaxID=64002 RepID=UPI0012EBC582|nr:hypothetical protein [Nevskia ramosa]
MNESEHKRLMMCRRAYEAGNKAGAIEAFSILTKNGVPLPSWLKTAMMEFIAAATEENREPHRSAMRAWVKQHRADRRDYERWDTVLEGRDSHGLQISNDEAFRAAQVILRRDRSISVGSIERSYKEVERQKKGDPLRYFSTNAIRIDKPSTRRKHPGKRPSELGAVALSALLDERDPRTSHRKVKGRKES